MKVPTIAVASGKGGTGKTTIAVGMAAATADTVLLDCDVEAPNCHLFLHCEETTEKTVSILIPEVDSGKCDACGECARFCAFNAIAVIGRSPLIFTELCHGCGGCAKICPRQAIREVEKRIGVVRTSRTEEGIALIQGCLDVGLPIAPPLVRAVRSAIPPFRPVIVDAPPGTSCTAVAALREAAYAILVTEPTPFGLYDLRLAVDMAAAIGVPVGVVVNRMGIGDGRVHDFCREKGIQILLEIPDDRRIAEAYSRGRTLIDAAPEYGEKLAKLYKKVCRLAERMAAAG